MNEDADAVRFCHETYEFPGSLLIYCSVPHCLEHADLTRAKLNPTTQSKVKIYEVRCSRCTLGGGVVPIRLCVTLTRRSAESVALAHRLRTLHAPTEIVGRYYRPKVTR